MGLANFVRKVLVGDAAERHSAYVDEQINAEKTRLRATMADSEMSMHLTRQNAQITQSSSRLMNTMSGMLDINRRGES